MKVILAVFAKENVGVVLRVKWLFVLGILKHQAKLYTVIFSDTKTNTLIPIISSKIKLDSIVYTDSWRLYNALNVSRFHHERINHSTDFAKGKIISIVLKIFGAGQTNFEEI